MFNNIKSQKFSCVNKFIKNNLWITPLIYIIGTITLLIRNKMFGLQFSSISLLHFSLIVVYLIIFLIMYSLIEFNFISLFNIFLKKRDNKIITIIGHVIIFFIYYIIIFSFLYLLTDDIILTKNILLSYYVFCPLFVTLLDNRDLLMSNIINIVLFITLIMNIPISLGGFKGQNVIFHSFNNKKLDHYVYYGNYDGLYQFVSKGKVVLMPIDSGFIEYKK